MERKDVEAARERLAARGGTANVVELAHAADLSVALVAEVLAGRLRPDPWVRERLAAALGIELLDVSG